MQELTALKARYEKRLQSKKPHRTDPEAEIVLRQITVIEQYLITLASKRKELYGFYDDDFFSMPSTQRAIKELRAEIGKIKEAVTTLGFEQYIPPDTIDQM